MRVVRIREGWSVLRVASCIVCLLMFCVGLIQAESGYTVKTIPNVRLQNRFNHVSNPDAILDAAAVGQINNSLIHLEDSLGIEVAVVAVRKLKDADNRSFATELFEAWGIGKEKEDNGLLILLVTDPAHRSVVFETGYGLEGVLPDAVCKMLQQKSMIPYFKSEKYNEGMVAGVKSVSEYLLRNGTAAGTDGDDSDVGLMDIIIGIVVLLLGGAFVWRSNRPSVCPRCGARSYRLTGAETLREASPFCDGIEVVTYTCSKCGYIHRERRDINRSNHNNTWGGGFIGGGFIGGGGSDVGGSWGGGSSGGGGSESDF